MSGEKEKLEKIKRIDLKLVLNDVARPILHVNFLNMYDVVTGVTKREGEKKDSAKYKEAKRKADQWYGLLSVLIKRAERTTSNI
ncbi:hypothetical protein D3C81_1345870 [compost metagenome]